MSRISISLASRLLKELNKSMVKASFSDGSNAIQSSLYTFMDENKWKGTEDQTGAGAIVLL